MAVSFPRLPRWLCGGNSKDREKPKGGGSSSSSSSSSSVSTSLKKSNNNNKTMKKMMKKEEKMGNVVFPEPDDPEWSIGWVEPHGPGFKTDDNDDDCGGFMVLVPCYKKVIDVKNQIPSNGFFFSPAPDGKNMEQWLSSMGKI